MSKFTIKVTATLNGKTCKNPQIEFIQGEDFLYPCEIKDGEITFEIKPGTNPNACVEGYIKCEDECLNCPPQYFKKCLCNDVTLLEACQKCVDGFIVDTCTPAQIAMGMICTPDGCQCPPSSPIKDPNTGQCVQCITGTVSGCKVCVAGHWEDIVCPAGERCDNGVCKCPPGYVRDPFTGLCIVKPSCDEDTDCGLCEICVSGNCVPLVCPEGYKCVNGECVYWPCTNTNCENGADCGEGCGCLNGVCTPCYLLDCANPTGLSIYPACTGALGCKCSGTACVPVDNCDQYCDSFTPCTEPGCTCYNNRCVSCANFPCVTTEGGCDSYYNCECTNGVCGGDNDGCTDNLVIKQECGSNVNDCKLIAELVSKDCKCDPVEFRTKNLKTCTAPVLSGGGGEESLGPVSYLTLDVEMFKNNISFKNFKDTIQFGDNEFVEATISTVIQHYTKNASGAWEKVNTVSGISSVLDVYPNTNNVIPNISINSTHMLESIGNKKTKVQISVLAKSVKIPNNNCTGYGTEEIASYEIDFTTAATACSAINAAKTLQVKALGSNTSKIPLFIWSKGVSDMKSTAYVNNKVYEQSGWFRKVYGVKSGNVWKDTISKFTDPDELWNNYNYQVKVDCGCATVANKNKLLFCCPPTFNYEFTNCNKKLVIQPFNVCNVNGKIDSFAPINSQTNYYVRLTLKNGAERNVLIPFNTNTKTITFTYDQPDDESIVSAVIFQSYQGGLLTPYECPTDLVVPEVADVNVTYTRDCDFINPFDDSRVILITVPQLSGAVKIKKIEFYRNVNNTTTLGNFNLGLNNSQPDISAATQYSTGLPKNLVNPALMTVVMRVFFTNGCSKDIRIQPCDANLQYNPNPGVSTLNCDNGIGAAITAVTDGYDTSLPINFGLEGENLAQPIENTTGIFTNLAAGDYVLTAWQGDLTRSVAVVVIEVVNPTVTLLPSPICQGGNATLTISAASGTAFTVTGPNGLVIANPVVSNSGVFTITNLTAPGNYTVTLTSDPSNVYCPQFSEVKVLATGGQALTPIIEIQPGNYCVGQAIPFRIRDNGAGATYTLSSNGSGSLPATLQSSNTVYNGSYVPNSTNGIIRITGVTDSCNTTTTPQIPVVVLANPVISTAISSCAGDKTNTVTVTTTGATGVTVEGVAAVETPPASGIYIRSNITGLTHVDIIATNAAGCTATQNLMLGDCLCPTGELFLIGAGDTCGQGTSTATYFGDTLGIDGTWQYVFQQMSGGDYIDLGVPAFFPVVPLFPAPTINIPTTVGETTFIRLKAINPTNGCEYVSLSVSATANPKPTGLSITPSVQLPVQTNVPISFSTQAGYFSYVWSGDVAGSTNTSTPKIFTTADTYQATVTVCSAVGCCEVFSLNFDVIQSCPPITFGSPSSGLCSDIVITTNGGVGARAYEVFGTYINVASTPLPGNTITIPTAGVPVGESDTLALVVTDANGCSDNIEIPYTRCSCVCNGTSCDSVYTRTAGGNNGVNDLIGSFTTGTVIKWTFSPLGQADRMVIKENGVTILNTGAVSAYSTCACASIVIPTVCSCADLYLGDEVGNLAVPLTVGTGDVSANTFSTCPTNVLEVQSVVADLINGIPGEIGGTLTLSGTGNVTVEITPNSCGGSGTAWTYVIAC